MVNQYKAAVKELVGVALAVHGGSDRFCIKVESFYNPFIKKVNITIDSDPHQLFKGSILLCNMYQEICKKFVQENSDVSFEEYLTMKYGLWITTRWPVNNKLHCSGRPGNSGFKLKINKAVQTAGTLVCYIFTVQDAYGHFDEGMLGTIDM